MFVQQVDSTGHPVGTAKQVGPANASSQPEWSPLGRYLVWQRFRTTGPTVIDLYDSTLGKLHELSNPNNADASSSGVGIELVTMGQHTAAIKMYDVALHAHATGQATFSSGQVMSAVAAAHTQAIVETGSFNGNGKPATLWLLPPTGAPVKLGTVEPVSFLGEHQAPAIGYRASTLDGGTTAIVTGLGQDGVCAQGQDVHVLDLVQHTDTVVPLPLKQGTLLAPSYSPSNVLGGISADCGNEGNDTKNSFVELHGSSWTAVTSGATIGARGPDGLLAVQLGKFEAHDFVPQPSQDHPLEIRDATGKTVASLPTSWSVAWTQAAVAPAAT